jgi:hypothetical protein
VEAQAADPARQEARGVFAIHRKAAQRDPLHEVVALHQDRGHRNVSAAVLLEGPVVDSEQVRAPGLGHGAER